MSIQSEFFSKVRVYEDLNHDCSNFLQLRERNKGSGTAYAYQCQVCGEARGGEVSKKKIINTPPPFDDELSDSYDAKSKSLADISWKERVQSSDGHAYVPAPSAKEITQQKLTELFEDLQKEFPNDDITNIVQHYLIRDRERKTDAIAPNWTSEPELKAWFKDTFSQWFDIQEEVWGSGYLNREKQRLRIDFVIKAKPILVSAGFTEQYIGVEAKFFDHRTGKGFHGKSSRGIFQALSYWYSGSVWEVEEQEPQQLATVLLFSNLSFSNDRNALFNTYDLHYRTLWGSYLSIASHANVGELRITDYRSKGWAWSIDFTSSRYFSKQLDGTLKMGNPNLINKQRIGNISSKK